MNIFFEKYNTPHDAFPFDKVKLDDYEPAMRRGMDIENDEMDRLMNNPEPPTFANTIEAMERSGELLGEVTEIFFNLTSAETNDAMDELAEKMSPILSDHANNIMLNPKLFERVKAVYEQDKRTPLPLSLEERRLLDDTYLGFVRSGADLPQDKRDRLKEIDNEMSRLDLQFSQNKLKEINAFTLHITDEADLAGLPPTAIDAARQAAKDKKKDGWVITLHAPQQPTRTATAIVDGIQHHLHPQRAARQPRHSAPHRRPEPRAGTDSGL